MQYRQLDRAIMIFCAIVAIFAVLTPSASSPAEEEPTYIEKLNGVMEENTYYPVVAVERPSVAQQKLLEMYACDDTFSENNLDAAPTEEAEESTGIQKETVAELPTGARTTDSAEAQAVAVESPDESPAPLWSTADVEILCKTVFGEAGSGSTPEQMAAVVWCVLNRVDDPVFPDNISDAATQAYQFQGYNQWNPIDPNVERVVLDVLERWQREKSGETDVGRILPREYLYFLGDGVVNHYMKSFGADEEWDWSLPSPYQAEK